MGRMELQVVEEVSGWLRVMSDGSVDRAWGGEEEVNPLVRVVPPCASFVDGVATRDVVVDHETGVRVRIYLPEKEEKLGVVLHFHGGGFCVSRADWRLYYQFYATLAKECGVICVSVDYRLAPEHRLPAAIEDCFGALAWLRSVARGDAEDEWLTRRADFSRCFLAGESAGGVLAHHVALLAARTPMHPLSLRGVVSIHPGILKGQRSRSESETQADSPFVTPEMIDKFTMLSLPVGSGRDHPITNPMSPDAPSLAGLKLPRFLVAVADRDLFRDNDLEYCEAMKAAGQSVEVLVSENVVHCFYLNDIAVKHDPHTAQQTANLVAAIRRFILHS